MQITLKEVHREGIGRNSHIVFDIYNHSETEFLNCSMIVSKDSASFMRGNRESLSMEEMEIITFEMRKQMFKILTGFD
jgi:hypothetical protein